MIVESFLIVAVTTLHFAIVPKCSRANKLMGNMQFYAYAVKRMKYNAEQKTIDRLADYDTRETLWGLLAGATIVVGVGIIVYQIFDIITCFTFPEDMIIGKLQVIYSRMKQ